jgi:GNAT superfamily N-acetyltransferase
MRDFTIQRWTSPERLDDIMAMVHAAFAGFSPPSGVLNETAADLAQRQGDGCVLVAMAGGDFIGSVFCAEKDGGLYLTRMATRPDWRRRGVGKALLGAAEAEAQRHALGKIVVRVRQTLPGNRAWFGQHGFAVTGEGQEEGRRPFDVMEKRLGPRFGGDDSRGSQANR